MPLLLLADPANSLTVDPPHDVAVHEMYVDGVGPAAAAVLNPPVTRVLGYNKRLKSLS